MRRPPRTSPRATWCRRAMTIEIREGRGCGPKKDHIDLHLEHLGAELLHERLPGISETREDLRRRRRDQGADPGAADRALQHGRHPDELSRRGGDPEGDGDPDAVVPGLMAVGEAACVSVHGANRLGSNSLLDLVVFGRAAAHRARRDDQAGRHASRRCRPTRASAALARFDRAAPCQGRHPDRRAAAGDAADHAGDAAVFRTGETAVGGRGEDAAGLARHRRHVGVPTAA